MNHANVARIAALLTLTLLLAVPAAAVTWGGDLGRVHLSFAPAPDLRPVLEQEPEPGLGLLVDVYAVMKDVDPVLFAGERILAIGGFELRLRVDGPPGVQVLAKEVPIAHLDVAEDAAGIMCGLQPDMTFTDEGIVLARWQVRIPGEKTVPVSFHLDPAGTRSSRGVPEAEGSDPFMVWTGSLQTGQHGLMFSAGYVPAWLNPDGEPDLAPRAGKISWRDTGLFTTSD